ncbi:zinc knuckle protein [Trichinella spiralis]|nr:zinc knuckle protein [Trichinella spiralis]
MDQNVDALTALGKDLSTEVLTAAECLITVAQELLPEQDRTKWDEQTMEDESAQSDLSRFMQYLRNQAELMQHNHRPSSLVSAGMPSSVAQTPQKTTNLGEHGKTATHLQASVTDRCLVCRGSHQASDCPVIWKAARGQRRALVRKAGLCFHCLKPGHVAKECGRGGDEKPKNGNSSENPEPRG